MSRYRALYPVCCHVCCTACYTTSFAQHLSSRAVPGNPGPASLEDQALALLLMVRARSLSPLLPRLAAYVAAGGSSSSPALSRRRVYYPESWFVQVRGHGIHPQQR